MCCFTTAIGKGLVQGPSAQHGLGAPNPRALWLGKSFGKCGVGTAHRQETRGTGERGQQVEDDNGVDELT